MNTEPLKILVHLPSSRPREPLVCHSYAELTWTDLLGDVEIVVGAENFGQRSIPLLGFVEELQRCLRELTGEGTSGLDWLGGHMPLILHLEGETLRVGDDSLKRAVAFSEFVLQVKETSNQVPKDVEVLCPELLQNGEYLLWKGNISSI